MYAVRQTNIPLGVMYLRSGTSVTELTHYASLCMTLECKLFS